MGRPQLDTEQSLAGDRRVWGQAHEGRVGRVGLLQPSREGSGGRGG